MTRFAFALSLVVFCTPLGARGWMQWGFGPDHGNQTGATGQSFSRIVGSFVGDRFAHEIIDDAGALVVHYQAPIVDRSDIVMMCKTSKFTTRIEWRGVKA